MPSGALHPIAPARLNRPTGRADLLPVGVWVWLASELMFFAALFAAFFMIREATAGMSELSEGGKTFFASQHHHLNVPFAAVNTVILVLSSVTCQIGVHAAEHGQVARRGSLLQVGRWGMREWYTLTFILGSIFIAGQATEYASLAMEGFTPQTNVYWSLFFVATGFHGLHVTGGLIAFLFTLGRSYKARTYTHEQTVAAMVVSYYWHFVDAVWIVLFAAIYILA